MGGMIRVIMSKFKELLQVERCTVFVVNYEENLLWSTVAEDTATIKVPMGKGICGYVAEHKKTVNIQNAYEDKRFNPEVDRLTGYHTKSILCTPIWSTTGNVSITPKQAAAQLTSGRESKVDAAAAASAPALAIDRALSGPATGGSERSIIGVIQIVS